MAQKKWHESFLIMRVRGPWGGSAVGGQAARGGCEDNGDDNDQEDVSVSPLPPLRDVHAERPTFVARYVPSGFLVSRLSRTRPRGHPLSPSSDPSFFFIPRSPPSDPSQPPLARRLGCVAGPIWK